MASMGAGTGAGLQMHSKRVVGLLQPFDMVSGLSGQILQHAVFLQTFFLLLVLDRDCALEELVLAA